MNSIKPLIKLPLFWRMFIATLMVVLLTSILSILLERTLMTTAIDERMQQRVTELVKAQAQIASYLESSDFKAVATFYQNNRKLNQQLVVVDTNDNILFPKQRVKHSNSNAHHRAKNGIDAANTNNSGNRSNRQPNNQADRQFNPPNKPDNPTSDQPFDQPPPPKHKPTLSLLADNSEAIKNALNAWRTGVELPETVVTLADGQTARILLYPRLPYQDILAVQQNYMGLRLLLLLLFSVLICYWLSQALTGRIKKVQQAVRHLGQGDYRSGAQLSTTEQYNLTHLGTDEIGELAQDIATLATRLQQSEQARRQMLSDISHELRSPLARLEVATELARDNTAHIYDAYTKAASTQVEPAAFTKTTFAKTTQHFDRIQQESARLNALIGQIIHIQSLQMGVGSGTPDKQPCNVVTLIEQIGEDVCFEFAQKNIKWHIALPHPKPAHTYSSSSNIVLSNAKHTLVDDSNKFIATEFTILADAEQLYSALENIIRNAFMHTKDNSHVTVRLFCDDESTNRQHQVNNEANKHSQSALAKNHLAKNDTAKNDTAKTMVLNTVGLNTVVIEVQDEGAGIDDEDIERIFQPFVRLDSARHRKTGGYGLGLAIAQGVIHAHGGTLSARNRSDGKSGLIVKITLPIKKA